MPTHTATLTHHQLLHNFSILSLHNLKIVVKIASSGVRRHVLYNIVCMHFLIISLKFAEYLLSYMVLSVWSGGRGGGDIEVNGMADGWAGGSGGT